jgi:anion-transporting  ArsA/GET3 family ATPase
MVPDRRVLVVTGKGGVGKTTVALALAMASAESGARTLLCETGGAARAPAILRRPPSGYEVTTAAPRLSLLSITSAEAIEEYVVRMLHSRRLFRLVFRNRVMAPFVDAVPGLHDLIQLGKVFDLERAVDRGRPAWDRIIVDAPATGHGLTMLASPRAMMDLTVAGPFHDNARDVATLYEDATRVGLVLVTTPEELPVNETLELHARLGPLQRQVRGIVLNEIHPPPVPDPEFLDEVRGHLSREIAAAPVLPLLADAQAREGAQSRARTRLGELGLPIVELPFLFHRDLSRDDVAELSRALGAPPAAGPGAA